MAKYVIKRVAYGVVTLFVLVSLTFFMQQLLPGDPFVGEKNLPEATMEALYAKYGLDKPVWMQYFIYLGNVLHGDLGISLQNDRPVTTVIGESFVVSFDVGIRAILFAFILGVVLGTLAAIKRGTAVDTICMLVALVGVSVPSFIVASLLQYYLGMRITMALGTPVFATTGWDGLNSKILPVFALGFSSLAQISRLTRTSMLDVLGLDPASEQWRGQAGIGAGASGAAAAEHSALDALVQAVLEERAAARAAKDWARADELRDRLAAAGVTVADGRDGATWSVG